jgi:hypothetical protein
VGRQLSQLTIIKNYNAGAIMQSRLWSLTESLVNVVVGYVIAVSAQMYIFHLIGEPISWKTSNIVGAFMTVISILRSYTLRRIFNAFTIRRMKSHASSRQNHSSN